MKFCSISKEKFEAFFYGRTPYVKMFSEEIEWLIFEHELSTILAVIIKCKIDNDLNAIVLGRDIKRKFRAIHVIVSKDSREELITDLNNCIDDLVNSHVNGVFPQGDENGEPFSIFNPRIPEKKRNLYLKLLTEDPVHFPAKVMMEELAHWFEDSDGMFISRMQGNEFNSRLFELYLHAVFYELEFEIIRSYPHPDYILKKAGQTIAIEATTVAEIEGLEESIEFNKERRNALITHVNDEMPFKFRTTLRNKVRHRPEPANLHYWELPHTKGHPFILAVHDYSRKMSMAYSSSAMLSYLYGLVERDGKLEKIENHAIDNRTIPSNFFGDKRNKYVSAVMLPTGATIPKFNRMGRIAGILSPNSFAFIHGIRTNHEGELNSFSALVENPHYRELWSEGIYIFHNPNAVYPLNPKLFHNVIHIFGDNGEITEWTPPNYIISSWTEMMITDEETAEQIWKDCKIAK